MRWTLRASQRMNARPCHLQIQTWGPRKGKTALSDRDDFASDTWSVHDMAWPDLVILCRKLINQRMFLK